MVDSLSSLLNDTDYIGLAADRSGNFYQVVARSGEPQSAWVVTYEKDRIRRNVYYGKTSTYWPSGGWNVGPTWIEFPDIGSVSPGGLYLKSGVYISPSSQLTVNGVVSATSAGITAGGSLTATNYGITASGVTAGAGASFGIKCAPEVFSGGNLTGFTFSSQNTDLGTAKLTTANGNSIVQMPSPKFEAKNISGAGFSIEGSGAKGYDHNGNVVWDTTKPAKLIGWSNYQGTAIDPRASGINGSIIATVYPDQVPASMTISSAPYSYMDGYGVYACYPDGTKLSLDTTRKRISTVDATMSASAIMDNVDVSYNKYNSATSATDVWSLTGSVQKREIECDSATSAITAIAGSAVGGGSTYSAGANIDITDDVISGKDWSDEIASATSGLQPSGDYYSASNPSGFLTEIPSGVMQTSGLEYDGDKISGYMGSAFAGGGEVPEGVMVESAVGYNAVNEISGYNGSAIAQYGAEKQWLVHDDTLVHAANSAQYALGCNVSALQRLMGIDETVLWEGTDPLDQSCLVNGTRETATLSEPLSSFNKIRIYAVWNPWIGNFTGCNTFEYPGTNNKGGYIMNDCTNQGYIAGGSWSAGGTTFKLLKHWQAVYPAAKETSNGLGGIFKIVGIGRKQ